jgi:hypothetical protein
MIMPGRPETPITQLRGTGSLLEPHRQGGGTGWHAADPLIAHVIGYVRSPGWRASMADGSDQADRTIEKVTSWPCLCTFTEDCVELRDCGVGPRNDRIE